MITRTYPVKLDISQTVFGDCEKSGLLFFDIETTGLSPQSSSLYLIGTASFGASGWVITQWFAENPSEEAAVIHAFLLFASGFRQLIHFNGDHFDLPYLLSKCRLYALEDTLSSLASSDLYRMARPLKPLLGLTSLKQKSLEEYLGIRREDRMSGKDLIRVYQDYVSHPCEEALRLLLLHNYEDVLGMIAVLPVLSYRLLTDPALRIAGCETEETSVILRAQLPLAVPRPLSLRSRFFYLVCERKSCALRVNAARRTLKHFFADYQNYYYLPVEDTAIHKSVAGYVDKEFRRQAKARDCYVKKEGFFLPQASPLFEPVFREDYDSPTLYFACTQAFLHDPEKQKAYFLHLLRSVL